MRARKARSALVVLLSSTLAFPTPVFAQQQPATLAATEQRLAIDLRALRNVRDAINDAEFDPFVLAAQLPPSNQAIADFVRNEIGYEPYAGGLRFGVGTLMHGAGNSVDKSVLLAEMLRAQGQQVRLAGRSLEPAMAAELLGRSSAFSTTQLQPIGPSTDDPFVRHFATDENGKVNEDAIRETAKSLEDWAESIGKAVTFHDAVLNGRVTLRPQDDKTVRSAIAADHVWVEVREGDKWTAIDPVARWLAPGETLGEATWRGDALPPRYVPRMSIAVTIDSEGPGASRETVLNETVTLDSGADFGTLALVPDVADATDPKAFTAFTKMRPVLAWRGNVRNGLHFGIDGRLVPGDPIAAAAGRTQQTIQGAAGGAAAALQRLSAPPSAPAAIVARKLKTIELEITLSRGDESIRKVRRMLVDSSTLPSNSQDVLRRALIQRIEIGNVPGRLTASFVQANAAEAILANRDIMFTLVSDAAGVSTPNRDIVIEQRMSTLSSELLDFYYSRGVLLDRIAVTEHATIFPNRPQLVLMHKTVPLTDKPDAAPSRQFDIVENSVDVVRFEYEPAQLARLRRAAGVLDTVLEHALLKDGGRETVHPIFVATLKSDVGIKVLNPGQPADLPAIAPRLREAMAADLSEGKIVVVPERPTAPDQFTGWWRIDPSTGVVLGIVGVDRRGGSPFFERATIEGVLNIGMINVVMCGGTVAYTGGTKGDFARCWVLGMVLTGAAVIVAKVTAPLASGIAGRMFGSAGQGAVGAAGGIAGAATTGVRPPPVEVPATPAAAPGGPSMTGAAEAQAAATQVRPPVATANSGSSGAAAGGGGGGAGTPGSIRVSSLPSAPPSAQAPAAGQPATGQPAAAAGANPAAPAAPASGPPSLTSALQPPSAANPPAAGGAAAPSGAAAQPRPTGAQPAGQAPVGQTPAGQVPAAQQPTAPPATTQQPAGRPATAEQLAGSQPASGGNASPAAPATGGSPAAAPNPSPATPAASAPPAGPIRTASRTEIQPRPPGQKPPARAAVEGEAPPPAAPASPPNDPLEGLGDFGLAPAANPQRARAQAITAKQRAQIEEAQIAEAREAPQRAQFANDPLPESYLRAEQGLRTRIAELRAQPGDTGLPEARELGIGLSVRDGAIRSLSPPQRQVAVDAVDVMARADTGKTRLTQSELWNAARPIAGRDAPAPFANPAARPGRSINSTELAAASLIRAGRVPDVASFAQAAGISPNEAYTIIRAAMRDAQVPGY